MVSDLELNQGNTSSTIKKMEQMDLIEKVRAKDDERKVELALRPKGYELLDRIEKKAKEMQNRVFLDEKRNNKLIESIKEISNYLDYIIRMEEEK